MELWIRCGGRCEFSGIEFDSASVGAELKRPFHPSLDRIDASKGYTKENCRFVCIAVNIALNTFGDGVLDKICEARSGLKSGSGGPPRT